MTVLQLKTISRPLLLMRIFRGVVALAQFYLGKLDFCVCSSTLDTGIWERCTSMWAARLVHRQPTIRILETTLINRLADLCLSSYLKPRNLLARSLPLNFRTPQPLGGEFLNSLLAYTWLSVAYWLLYAFSSSPGGFWHSGDITCL